MATRRRRAPAKKPQRSSRKRPLLTSLSSDWYWEQDASLRFVRVDVQTGTPGEQELAARNLGRRPWQTGISVEGGWDRHRALLKARAPFREVLMWRDFDDGSRRYVSVSGEPVFDAKGRFTGYRGVGRDITQQKRGELLLRLQQTITHRLAEAPGPLEGIQAVLRAVCETEGWDCGELWRAAPGGDVMRRYAFWTLPGVEAAQRFVELSGGHDFRPGEGLVGAVWQAGAPLWIADTGSDERAVRKFLTQQTGLRGALLCPVLSDGRTTGVLAFACRRIRPPDEALLQALTAIATQLALYLRRMDSEARLRQSEARFRSLTDLSSDWFWEQDAQHRFTRLEGRNVAPDYVKQVIGKHCWDGDLEVEGGWPAYRERLGARATFHDVLMWRRAPDGETRYVRISGEPVYGADGAFAGYRGVGRDVSAQKRAEESLRESEERFRHTFELAGVGVAHIGLDRRFERVNRRLCEILGYPEAQLVGMKGRDISHPEDLDAMNLQRPALYAGEVDEVRGEKRYLRKDGAVVWVAYTLAIRRDAAGEPQYEIAVYDDISARKAAEAALRESEERFRRTFELAGSGVAHLSLERRFLRVNRKLTEILGYAESELIGRPVTDISHPGDLERTNEERERLYAGEIGSLSMEKRYVRKDGRVVWAGLTLALERDAAGTPQYEIAVYDDITARKAAESSMRESEERFRRTFELAGSGVAHVDMEGRFLRVNRRVCEMFGYPEAELVGRSVKELSHPDDRDITDTERARMHRGEIDLARFQKRYLRKDGSTLWAEMAVTAESDAAGTPLYEIAVLDDIGARKAAEAALQASEARFRSLSELSSDWFWELDTDYRFTRLEGRAVAGGDNALRQRLIGTRRWEGSLEIEGGWEAHRALLDARQPFHALMRRRMSDGNLRFMSVSGEPMFAPDGSFAGYRGVGRDITREKRAEQLLRLEHQVARALADAADESGGLQAVIRAVCEAEGWVSGRYLKVDDEAGLLRYQEGWSTPASAGRQLLERSPEHVYRPGEGLSGICWESGEPVWSADTLSDPRVAARSLTEGTGIRGVFAFPAVSDGKAVGVLSFASHSVREPDERLLQASRVVGAQVGQFLRRMGAEEALRESEARFRALTEMSSDFYWETDARHVLTGMTYGRGASGKLDQALGKAAWEVPSTHPDDAGWAALRAKVDARQPFRDFEFGRPRHDGGVRWFSVSGEPRLADNGRFLGYRGVGRDITEVVLARERIASLAYQDPLTGLANRTSLSPALEQAVERTRRRGSKLAGVFLDLDGFKQINDMHGHDAGDRLLVEAAQRLRAALRSSDPVARLGGDEFFVVLEDLQNNAPAERVARKLLAALLEPYELGEGRQARISASIGISVYPDDAGDAATLVKHADTAMYHAKQAGKNAYRFFAAGPAANDGRAAAVEEKGSGS